MENNTVSISLPPSIFYTIYFTILEDRSHNDSLEPTVSLASK